MSRFLWRLLVAYCGLTRRQESEFRILGYSAHEIRERQRTVVEVKCALRGVRAMLRAVACEVHPRILVYDVLDGLHGGLIVIVYGTRDLRALQDCL